MCSVPISQSDTKRRPPLGANQIIGLHSVIGLPLLYASGYYLPRLEAGGIYLLPSDDLFHWVVLPSFVALLVGGVILLGILGWAGRWCGSRLANTVAILALAYLFLIALKGILYAADYDWRNLVPRGSDLARSSAEFKLAAFLIAWGSVWLARGHLNKFVRILSSLGYAFCILAAVRLFILWNDAAATPPPAETATSSTLRRPLPSIAIPGRASAAPHTLPRRVVWVIFDESDYARIYEPVAPSQPELPNFERLARAAVSATNANSPASATLYSIPALLTGVSIGGTGIRLSHLGSLSLVRPDKGEVRFGEATSIFGALDAAGRTASVLGFYHPYCKLFKLRRCTSPAYPAVGGLDAALWANIPEVVAARIQHFEQWQSITREALTLLPEYLARDDDLTFVHLNVPHLSALYADATLHLPTSSDPLVEYAHNLVLADRILGGIIKDLEKQASRHELLLVVSSDHWLRRMWFRPNESEVSRPIPFIAWKVGDTGGIVLSQPLSTVHTAAMIIDYLNGTIGSQTDIANWWVSQPVDESFIAPNY
jgi:hypothetical protein